MISTNEYAIAEYRKIFVEDIRIIKTIFESNVGRSDRLLAWVESDSQLTAQLSHSDTLATEVVRWSLVNAVSAMDTFFRQFVSCVDTTIVLGASAVVGTLMSTKSRSVSFDSRILSILYGPDDDLLLKYRAMKLVCHTSLERTVFQNSGKIFDELSDRGLLKFSDLIRDKNVRRAVKTNVDAAIDRRNRIVHRGDEAYDLAQEIAPFDLLEARELISSIRTFVDVYHVRSSALVFNHA